MMTWPLLPLRETAGAFAVCAGVGGAAIRSLQVGRARTWIARASALLAAFTATGLLLWASGSPSLAGRGVSMSWIGVVLTAPLAASLVGCALLTRFARRPSAVPASPARRAFLEASAFGLPAASLATSAGGFSLAGAAQRIPVVRMRFPDLHPDLEGLRILQLSDLHLGAAMRCADLEALLVRAAALAPDLIVLTGDVADDLHELEQALAVVHQHRPRLGVLAALGNHEYLHDIRATRPLYERSRVPLLVDRGVTLAVGDAKLHVAGVDDPFGKGQSDEAFYKRAVGRAMAGAPQDAFRLLLCHRPQGFRAAAARGVELTLSGHTHGGQVGLFGMSAFQAILPRELLWGSYEERGSRLYTTSGFGHWFPFRLGCPTEAPLIVLERGRPT